MILLKINRIKKKQNFALKALAEQENIEVDEKVVEKKLHEVQRELKNEKNIDQKKLRQAIVDDVLQETLFERLEENKTVIEKAPNKKTQKKESDSKKKTKTKTEKTNKDSPEK